jgi:hypothetical protein
MTQKKIRISNTKKSQAYTRTELLSPPKKPTQTNLREKPKHVHSNKILKSTTPPKKESQIHTKIPPPPPKKKEEEEEEEEEEAKYLLPHRIYNSIRTKKKKRKTLVNVQ